MLILVILSFSSCDWTMEIDTSIFPDKKYSVALYDISDWTGKPIAEFGESFSYGSVDGAWWEISKTLRSVVWEEKKVVIVLYGL